MHKIILFSVLTILSCKSQEKEGNFSEVINAIISDAEKHQVVMINEDHDTPKHRVFSETLLKPLYNLGFRYLAVETLSESDTILNKRKFPIKQSGTYSVEPNYANFIRTALEMGYTLVPYEIRMDEEDELGEQNFITFREECQSQHLAELIKQKPKAKIFVHAGGDHIREKTKTKWMAERFKEKTGINPLTISQSHLDEKQNLNDIKIHKQFSDKFDVDILLEYSKNNQVVNKLYSVLNRVLVEFNLDVLPQSKIYITTEYSKFGDNAIPVSIVNQSNKAYLMPNKAYVIIIDNLKNTFNITENGKVMWNQNNEL
ncbi:hypothetical protein [Yeosuana marina]|uniref:hypothetical protein n=1 Tax=Yeosuana marina TaxID=1565536 RepID=UPI00142198DE|nr:hypothetical protein [Yeosuana marina]